MASSDRVAFTCDGVPVEAPVDDSTSLLEVLREHLGARSPKDGCAPQGQCGCCTVLVDGEARVACVTPATRIEGRAVTTADGLAPELRERLARAFVATGGSQCGFCTPGILVRVAWLLDRGRTGPVDLDRALAAHLCRCTGWLTVREAVATAAVDSVAPARDLEAAGRRAALEGGGPQRVAPDVPLGHGGFADDGSPPDALVAVPFASGSDAAEAASGAVFAAGLRWVTAPTLPAARARAGKVQGRRTTQPSRPPLDPPALPAGGVLLATSWVEPAYLEPDASWCEPGGTPASPLANGGAFGGKAASTTPAAARELADQLGCAVRVVFAREDVVRLGPKRPPMAATAVLDGNVVRISGSVIGDDAPRLDAMLPYRLGIEEQWHHVASPGPRTSTLLRAWPLAERTVLVEGALTEAGVDRGTLVRDDRVGAVVLDTCAAHPDGDALAGARVIIDPAVGTVERIEARVAAGDPLDDVVLRSYCIGAAHMALGWVLSEALAVDPESGEILDLTIRSFGIIRAKDMPPVDLAVVDDPGPPRAHASDAVFAAVAAATWNAVAAADGARPEAFPARESRAARALGR